MGERQSNSPDTRPKHPSGDQESTEVETDTLMRII